MSEENKVLAPNKKDHSSDITYIDNNTADAIIMNKQGAASDLAQKLGVNDTDIMQFSTSYPFAVSGISHILTQVKREIKEGTLNSNDAEKIVFKGGRYGTEGGYIGILVSWEAWKYATTKNHIGLYKQMKDEADRLLKNPPKKIVPIKQHKDGSIAYTECTPIFVGHIYRTGKPASEGSGKLIETERNAIEIFVKEHFVSNLLNMNDNAGNVLPGPTAFYGGLQEIAERNNDLNELIKLTKKSISIYFSAYIYLRRKDGGKGKTKHINLIDFWECTSIKEISNKNGKKYLRNSISKSLLFFKTLCLLLCDYSNKYEQEFTVRDLFPYAAELGQEPNTIELQVYRTTKKNPLPPLFKGLNEKIKALIEENMASK